MQNIPVDDEKCGVKRTIHTHIPHIHINPYVYVGRRRRRDVLHVSYTTATVGLANCRLEI